MLALPLSGSGGDGRLRCVACWRVDFVALWINSQIEASHSEEAFARLIISDGRRLYVECLDAEFIASEPGELDFTVP